MIIIGSIAIVIGVIILVIGYSIKIKATELLETHKDK